MTKNKGLVFIGCIAIFVTIGQFLFFFEIMKVRSVDEWVLITSFCLLSSIMTALLGMLLADKIAER